MYAYIHSPILGRALPYLTYHYFADSQGMVIHLGAHLTRGGLVVVKFILLRDSMYHHLEETPLV